MNQHCSTSRKTGLLVSVRSVEEARIAHTAGCVSIVDLKEPNDGSLGCVPFETARKIHKALPLSTIKSIALGEATGSRLWPAQKNDAKIALLSHFHFAKVGLSGLANDTAWVRRWSESFEIVPDGVQRVAVAYADHEKANSPSIESVIESAHEVGCSVLLIDTFQKGQGGLLDFTPPKELKTIVGAAKAMNLKVVLAGSLKQDHVALVQTFSPDFVAVRGAVCRDSRESTIEEAKIHSFGRLLRLSNSR